MEQVRILLARVSAGRAEKSVIMTGLRGVGKTVLLNRLAMTATEAGFKTIQMEAMEDEPFVALLAPQLRRLLFDLDRVAGAGEKVRRGLAVLQSFLSAFKLTVGNLNLELDIAPMKGVADSGDLAVDLPDLVEAVAEAAAERKTLIALFVDELQYLNSTELGAFIVAMHRIQQKSLPLVLIGAGLPTLPALAGEAKSYSERLFNFPELGALTKTDAFKAIKDPVNATKVKIGEEALERIFQVTRGYPYFIQEWGYQSWNAAESSPITTNDVHLATRASIEQLDRNFFRVRFDRLAPSEKRFLRAIAELGSDPHQMGDVAEKLGMKSTSLGPVRASLLRKGMIYSPAHGQVAFTVPLFDEFMRRVMPKFPSA